jgi:hypothetical protein
MGLSLMREHVGNYGVDDVCAGIDDHDILAPNEIKEIGVGDLGQKVIWRGKSATLAGSVAPTLTLTLLVGTKETGAPCPAK